MAETLNSSISDAASKMTEEERENFIQGIEQSIDYNDKIPREDMELYREIKVQEKFSKMGKSEKEYIMEIYEYGKPEKPEERLLYDKVIDENKRLELIKDKAGREVMSGFRAFTDSVKSEMLRQYTVSGVRAGRIVNDSNMRNYAAIEVKGKEKTQEIEFKVDYVENNKVYSSRQFTAKEQTSDFQANIDIAIESAYRSLGESLYRHGFREIDNAEKVDLKKDSYFTLYSAEAEHTLQEHYEKLKDLGCRQFPFSVSEQYEMKYTDFIATELDKRIYKDYTGRELSGFPPEARLELEMLAERNDSQSYYEFRDVVLKWQPEYREQLNKNDEQSRNSAKLMQGRSR